MRQFFASLFEVLEVALVALGAVFLVRTFLVQPFLVSGASMVPNFASGDYLLIDQLTYRFRVPERGEVIVFRYPKDNSTYFIKRIVGLPGERIEIREGKVLVFTAGRLDRAPLEESYLGPGVVTAPRSSPLLTTSLGDDEYFVLGDNRSYSFDSRDWGVLKARDIVGLARLRLWPVKDLTVFAAPQYQGL